MTNAMDEATPAPEPLEPSLELRPRRDRWKVLEQRLAKLEQAVAQWPDASALQERLLRHLREEAPAANGAWADKVQAEPPSLRPRDDPSESRAAPPPVPAPPVAVSAGWLLFDTWRELRLIARMFRDLRYRVRWFTWFIVLLFLPIILLSEWWFPPAWIPVIGGYLDKIMCVILAFVVYKALSREAKRYQATVSAAIDYHSPPTTHHPPP